MTQCRACSSPLLPPDLVNVVGGPSSAPLLETALIMNVRMSASCLLHSLYFSSSKNLIFLAYEDSLFLSSK